jgi:hypothetical protein
MIGPILGETDPQVLNEALDVEREEAAGDREDEKKNDVLRGHAFASVNVLALPRAPLA